MFDERRNPSIELPPPPEQPSLLTVRIELSGTEPRVWRRLVLPGDLTLDAVHLAFQAAMGWTDSHLHRFQPRDGEPFRTPHFVTEFDEDEGDEGTREEDVRLDQVLRSPGDPLTYLYDFGDGWVHLVTLEALQRLSDGSRRLACLDGAYACPPEDVGGIGGHKDVSDWLRAGAPHDAVPEPFDDAAHALSWLPEGYDPDAFDPAAATEAMGVWARGEHVPWHGVPEPLAQIVRGIRGDGWRTTDAWLDALGKREPVVLDDADLERAARPWLAVLDAVGAGTKLTAAGYLPPALVTQIADAAGISAWWIGKVNREDLTWPVADLRATCQEVGLLRKAKGMLTPTARARRIDGDPGRLVAGVLERMPIGKDFDAEAGWLMLLALAAGESGEDLDARLAEILTDRGWRTRANSPVSPWDARRGGISTRNALETMAGIRARDGDPDLVTRLARGVLLGAVSRDP